VNLSLFSLQRSYMKKALLILTLSFAWAMTNAQVKFTEEIQRQVPGQGKIVLHQSSVINDLVNGIAPVRQPDTLKPVKKVTVPVVMTPQIEDTLLSDSSKLQPVGPRIRINGYRIQVYLGGNTGKSKAEAQMMKARVKSYFSELPVYAGFQSPHWICRAGDFRTYEEASEYLHKMRETGRFDEAVIIKSKINVRE